MTKDNLFLSLTLNPALDRALVIDKLSSRDVNRVKRQHDSPGGNGINVSLAITHLGGSSIALGFAGGSTGQKITSLLKKEGLQSDFVSIMDETRMNIIVKAGIQEYKFNLQGPAIRPHELDQLVKKLHKYLPNANSLFIGGSIPPNIPKSIYTYAIEISKAAEVKTVLDADGEALQNGLKAVPDVIKLNQFEAGRLLGRPLRTKADYADVIQLLRAQAIQLVLISIGSEGCIAGWDKEIYIFKPPKVTTQNTIGAGDCLLGVTVYNLVRGSSPKEAIRSGIAAATAKVGLPRNTYPKEKEIKTMKPKVKVYPLRIEISRKEKVPTGSF